MSLSNRKPQGDVASVKTCTDAKMRTWYKGINKKRADVQGFINIPLIDLQTSNHQRTLQCYGESGNVLTRAMVALLED